MSARPSDLHVSAAQDGVLVEWLHSDRGLVDAGAPIARPYPEVCS